MVNSYIALDIETTGLNPKQDRIIEIGAWKVIDGTIEEGFSKMINPKRKIPKFITELTHITDDHVREAPSIKEVLPDFLDFCEDFPVLGHQILFDYSFLKCQAVNIDRRFDKFGVDTLKLTRKLLPDLERKNLKDTCHFYGIGLEQAHRAFADARAAHLLFQALKKQFSAVEVRDFEAHPLIYKVKKEQTATKKQKEHLIDLVKYHRIDISVQIDDLSRNELSRMTDKIISKFGRLNKKR